MINHFTPDDESFYTEMINHFTPDSFIISVTTKEKIFGVQRCIVAVKDFSTRTFLSQKLSFLLYVLRQKDIQLINKLLRIGYTFILQQLTESTPQWFPTPNTSDIATGKKTDGRGIVLSQILHGCVKGDNWLLMRVNFGHFGIFMLSLRT